MRLKSILVAAAITAAAALSLAGPADAQLSWSFASGQVEMCPTTVNCAATPALVDVQHQFELGTNLDARAAVFDANFGSAVASAGAGTGGLLNFPVLHAYTSGAFVPALGGYSWNVATTQGVQGFRWSGQAGIDIPVDSFVGNAEFTNSGSGVGFVTASLALTTDAILQPDVGKAWYRYSTLPGLSGQFAADCNTTGAIALSNPALSITTGAGSIAVDPTSCLAGGASTFHLNPGDEFFIWSRLLSFRASDGISDAANTFTVGFSPTLATSTEQLLADNLVQVPGLDISTGVPEPGAWALMLLGFGGLGAALRAVRRKQIATLS